MKRKELMLFLGPLLSKIWEAQEKMTDWKYLFLQVYDHDIRAFS